MNNKNYTQTVITRVSTGEAFKKIMEVNNWWAKNFEGKTEKIGDTFTVRFGKDGKGDRYTMKVAEIIPNKKLVWDVVDAHQGWVKEPAEWVGTKIIWELSSTANGTEIKFTHKGLMPELECFNQCNKGWDYLLLESLSKLLDEGVGLPV